MVFSARRTFSDGDVALFVGATADYNVWHVDETAIGASWFAKRLVPGLLTASLTTQIGAWLGWLATRMEFTFVAPVYVGDTVTCTCTIASTDAARRRFVCDVRYQNDAGAEVLRGTMEGFPTRVPPAAQTYLDYREGAT